MQQRLPSLLDPPITFAHRGAKAHAPENTLEAFELAIRLGTSGLESDVWLTSDGVAVLDHDGDFRRGLSKKRSIRDVHSDDLPEHIPSLVELWQRCGTDYHLSLDIKDPSAGPVVIDLARQHAPDLISRLWLCDPDLDRLAGLRTFDDRVKLVNSVRVSKVDEGLERRASRLAELGIDGINMHFTDWNGGLVALFHRFERTAFSWDLQTDHQLRSAFRMGIDAVFSDYVDRMVEACRVELSSGP